MCKEENEEPPPEDWILNICKEGGEEPSAPFTMPEANSDSGKDDRLFPLRELKAAAGYSNPGYESPAQSSDEGPEKIPEKDVISKVPWDKERMDKNRSVRPSTSFDTGREIKRWKGEKDKADEVALIQNEWMGVQILLKLYGKSIEDIRQSEDLDDRETKRIEREKNDVKKIGKKGRNKGAKKV